MDGDMFGPLIAKLKLMLYLVIALTFIFAFSIGWFAGCQFGHDEGRRVGEKEGQRSVFHYFGYQEADAD